MNGNRVCTDRFSNPDTELLYKSMPPDNGPQCGGCTFFAPLNPDYGLCCNSESRHHLETVFEHFTCPSLVYEGWGHHSFAADPRYHCQCEMIEFERLGTGSPSKPWWRFW
jgi:hypothetical protein